MKSYQTNQYTNKIGLKNSTFRSLRKFVFFVILALVTLRAVQFYSRIIYYNWRDENVIAPCANFCAPVAFAIEPISESLSIDDMVDKYAKKYGKTIYKQNRLKALTHYLLLREQNYGGSDACGDQGLSCGPLQFRSGTYTANRQRMINLKLVDHMGSRLDMEDSIETAIYMFSIGQEKQWGPYYRGEIKL